MCTLATIMTSVYLNNYFLGISVTIINYGYLAIFDLCNRYVHHIFIRKVLYFVLYIGATTICILRKLCKASTMIKSIKQIYLVNLTR